LKLFKVFQDIREELMRAGLNKLYGITIFDYQGFKSRQWLRSKCEYYPQREVLFPDGKIEKGIDFFLSLLRRMRRPSQRRMKQFVTSVHRHADVFQLMSEAELQVELSQLKQQLSRQGLRKPLLAQSFALVREFSARVLGMRHYDCQIMGGWVLINGMLAEMQTGEGKTLTALLPACTSAFTGMPVHVISVNDYLTKRDAEVLRPVYEAMGLTVATVIEGQSEFERREIYQKDIVYCTNNEIAFDYLRDQVQLKNQSGNLHLQVQHLFGEHLPVRKLLLPGLCFAIVDEVDSVLIDEARMPLVLAGQDQGERWTFYQDAMAIAKQLVDPWDYKENSKGGFLKLTEHGRSRVEELRKKSTASWSSTLYCEELVVQALTALHKFHCDEHYLVQGGKIEIVDSNTGRISKDRSWQHGMHQMLELKEGCDLSKEKETLASTSYQKFFRRYYGLAGMTGTASEVAQELSRVYQLATVKIPTHKVSRRKRQGIKIYDSLDDKFKAISEKVRILHSQGQPILVGTVTVGSSEVLANLFEKEGMVFDILNARQDAGEADIIAKAGEKAAITIATSMAGRGTDIELGEGVDVLGGLYVIVAERAENKRVDRQLIGRCARQGDLGSYQEFLSLEDTILELNHCLGLVRWVQKCVKPTSILYQMYGKMLFIYAQWRQEKRHKKMRKQVLLSDEQQARVLAFSGTVDS